jgi:hypothetical protein
MGEREAPRTRTDRIHPRDPGREGRVWPVHDLRARNSVRPALRARSGLRVPYLFPGEARPNGQ